jgi:hypothetical protein
MPSLAQYLPFPLGQEPPFVQVSLVPVDWMLHETEQDIAAVHTELEQ